MWMYVHAIAKCATMVQYGGDAIKSSPLLVRLFGLYQEGMIPAAGAAIHSSCPSESDSASQSSAKNNVRPVCSSVIGLLPYAEKYSIVVNMLNDQQDSPYPTALTNPASPAESAVRGADIPVAVNATDGEMDGFLFIPLYNFVRKIVLCPVSIAGDG